MALINKLTAIADSIREKTGKEDSLTLDQMPLEIAGIQTGVELNFDVVGGTSAPASPSENMIWVNTENEITYWVFSATEPETIIEGAAWFFTGTSSAVEFNILKENSVQAYPLSAKQYINGTWIDVEAKSYQKGNWVEWWNGQLYVLGEEYKQITGGWMFTGEYGSKTDENITVGTTTEKAAFTGTVETVNLIDLTSFNTISIHVVSMGGSSSGSSKGELRICDSSNNVIATTDLFSGNTTITDKLVTLDISILTSEYKVVVFTGHASSTRSAYVTFDSIILS